MPLYGSVSTASSTKSGSQYCKVSYVTDQNQSDTLAPIIAVNGFFYSALSAVTWAMPKNNKTQEVVQE